MMWLEHILGVTRPKVTEESLIDLRGKAELKWQKKAEFREEKQGEDKLTNFLEISFCLRDSLHSLST